MGREKRETSFSDANQTGDGSSRKLRRLAVFSRVSHERWREESQGGDPYSRSGSSLPWTLERGSFVLNLDWPLGMTGGNVPDLEPKEEHIVC